MAVVCFLLAAPTAPLPTLAAEPAEIAARLWAAAGAKGAAPSLTIGETPLWAVVRDGKLVLSPRLLGVGEDALAFVIGHEFGHILHGHVPLHDVAARARAEIDADVLGLRLAIAAGYDRRRIVAFVAGLQQDPSPIYCPPAARARYLEIMP